MDWTAMTTPKTDGPANLTFGAKLRRLRETAGLTQETVAFRAGLKQSYVSQLETGARTAPNFVILAGIADALGVEAEELMTAAARGLAPQKLTVIPSTASIPIRDGSAGGEGAGNLPGGSTGHTRRLELGGLFDGDDLVAYVAHGQPMARAGITPGSYILVRDQTDPDQLPSGTIVLASLDGGLILGEYRCEADRRYLTPVGQGLTRIDVSDHGPDQLRVLGVYRGVVTVSDG